MSDAPQRITFETHAMQIMVEDISLAGSAFASNEEGDTVFLNKRLVERLALEGGEILMAQCIPNYEDKRDAIPWRCIRAAVLNVAPASSINTVKPGAAKPSIDDRIHDYMRKESEESESLDADHFITAGEVADALSINVDDVMNYFDKEESNYEILRCYRFKWL
jgi:hypothetical protein